MIAMIIAVVLYASLIYICGRFTANQAARKGRSRIAWFIWGGLLFPLPSIVLALLPSRRKEMIA